MSFRGPTILGLCRSPGDHCRMGALAMSRRGAPQRRLLFGIALTALVLACGSDPLKPSQLSGLYRLTLMDGHAPPELVDTSNTGHMYFRSGLLLIKSNGVDTLYARMDHGTFIGFTWVYAGTYTLTGRRLNFTNTYGSALTYTGAAGAQAVDIDLPFVIPGTFDFYTVVVSTHFEQICEGDQCTFSSAGPP